MGIGMGSNLSLQQCVAAALPLAADGSQHLLAVMHTGGQKHVRSRGRAGQHPTMLSHCSGSAQYPQLAAG